VSPFRPDLVGCWIFRETPGGLEILLIRRAPDRIYPGIWQCVTGGLEGDERVVDGALREVAEETGIDAAHIEVLYGLDQVNTFLAEHVDSLLAEAVFAAHIRAGVEPVLSAEHDDLRWVSPAEAREIVVWPAYRTAIDQIVWLVGHPDHAAWLRAGPWAIVAAAPPSDRLPGP
jgi:8-oxo-dGTP pyrophosphatase MutT (NUDIX family)